MNKTSHFIRLEMMMMAMEAVCFDYHTSKHIIDMIDNFTAKLLVEIEGMDPKRAKVFCQSRRRLLSFSMAEYDERVKLERKQSGSEPLQLAKAI